MKIPLPKSFAPRQPMIIHDLQEGALCLTSPQIDPAIINYQSLQQKSIISDSWIVAKNSVTKPNLQQLISPQGTKIIISKYQIKFIIINSCQNQEIINIIQQLLTSFQINKIALVTVGIRRLISLSSNLEKGNEFVSQYLQKSVFCESNNNNPVQIKLNFRYDLEPYPLNISLSSVKIKQPQKKAKSAILFQCLLSEKFKSNNYLFSFNKTTEIVNNYPTIFRKFNQLVEQIFLN